MTTKKWIKDNYSTESIIIENIEFISEMLNKYVLSLSPKNHVPDTGNMVPDVKYAVFFSCSEDTYEQLSNPFNAYKEAVEFAQRHKDRHPHTEIFAWMPLPKAPSNK